MNEQVDTIKIKKEGLLHNFKNSTIIKHFWKDRLLLLMLLPVLIQIFIFCYVPMYGILIAFQNFQVGNKIIAFDGSIEWVGVKHFIDFINSIFFTRVFGNALMNSTLYILCGFWVPIVFAIILNEIRNTTYKRLIQTFTYLPYFISTVVIVGIVLNIVSQDGPLNTLIEVLGGSKIQFMNRPEYFRPIYVLSGIWQNFGWGTVIYLASIASIDVNIYEAARVDGANRFKQIIHITLPGMAPTIVILLIFAIGSILTADTEKILLLYNPMVYDTADVIGTYVYRVGILGGKYSHTTAVGVFSTVINFMLLFGANKISKKLTDFGLW